MSRSKMLIAFLLLMVSIAPASKVGIPFEVAASLCDVIVYGEIVKDGEKAYTFKVFDCMKGVVEPVIKVNRFGEWQCDPRKHNGAPGTQLVLLLEKEANGWNTINGGTGEIMVRDGYVVIDHGYSRTIKVQEFINSMKLFVQSYRYVEGYRLGYAGAIFRQLVTDQKAKQFKNLNLFTLWLDNKLHRSYYSILKNPFGSTAEKK